MGTLSVQPIMFWGFQISGVLLKNVQSSIWPHFFNDSVKAVRITDQVIKTLRENFSKYYIVRFVNVYYKIVVRDCY